MSSVIQAVMLNVSGVSLSTQNSGQSKPAVSTGIINTARCIASAASQSPGFEIVRAVYNLTHLSGSNGASNIGTNDWATPANAQGINNATVATAAGDTLAVRAYKLSLAYADFANKSDLTITSAKLRYYIKQTGTALNNGGLSLKWQSTGALITVTTITDDQDLLTVPYLVDLFAAGVTTWAQLDALIARVDLDLPIATALVNASVDAVTLEVVASRTDTL
jgi:cytochrome c5